MWQENHLNRISLIHTHIHTYLSWKNQCVQPPEPVCVSVLLEGRPIGLTVHSLFMNETPSPRSPPAPTHFTARPPHHLNSLQVHMPWLLFFCTAHPVRRLQSKKRLRFTASIGPHFSFSFPTGFLEFSELTTLHRTLAHTHAVLFSRFLWCVSLMADEWEAQAAEKANQTECGTKTFVRSSSFNNARAFGHLVLPTI